MSKQTKYKKYTVLGVEIDAITIQQAVEAITALAAAPKSRAEYVVKPYVELVELASRDLKYRQILNHAYFSLPDGVSLKWAAYFLRCTRRRLLDVVFSGAQIVLAPAKISRLIPEHHGGVNFTWPLLKSSAEANLKVFLIGSPQGHSINSTAAYLRQRIPGLVITGTSEGRDAQTGNFSPRLEAAILKQLKELAPDLILMGIGYGQQEAVLARYAQQLPHGVLIGEGGTFDYEQFGGIKKRAPGWMQKTGLEWLFRLIQEPKRIIRQLAIPRFIWKVYRSSKNTIAI